MAPSDHKGHRSQIVRAKLTRNHIIATSLFGLRRPAL
jgi:hypothetical protein